MTDANNNTRFVYRITEHPAEDLERNWSAVMGGWGISDFVDTAYDTAEEAYSELAKYFDCDVEDMERKYDVRYHGAYGGFVEVHYEGLGAGLLEATNLQDAISEVRALDNIYDVACTMEAGDGHFCASEVLAYHKVEDDVYIFELS